MASSSSSIRTWRTAFLTLRDETLTIPTRTPLPHLLHSSVFFQSDALISAAPNLPPREVTSDVLFLLELTSTSFESSGEDDIILIYTQICHMTLNVSKYIAMELNSSSWAFMIDYFEKMVEFILDKPRQKRILSVNSAALKAVIDSLNILRRLIVTYHRNCSLAENIRLVKFLLRVVERSHGDEIGMKSPGYHSIWEVRTLAFTMIGEECSRVGSSIPIPLWQSAIEVLRKLMDGLGSKNLLVEDNAVSKFYISMLNCLHLVFTNPKGSISDHVPGFVTALRMFFVYGLTKNYSIVSRPVAVNNAQESNCSCPPRQKVAETTSNVSGPYRPPHLRKRDGTILQHPKASEIQSSLDYGKSKVEFTSSDSDYSDSDGSLKDYKNVYSSKVRVASLVCIQDLCQADPKSFTSQWTMLLPTVDVLQPRKYEATLMTCLLFDPHSKARIASASALAAMLDGPASNFLQIAEYKEQTKCGSFTPLSSSLGQILMQLHIGILHLIQHESHSGLLALLYKILSLLISSTPYARMHVQLLPTIISSLTAKVEEGYSSTMDQTGLLASAVSCMTTALSTSPCSPQVKEMLLEELSTDIVGVEGKRGVISIIFLCTKRVTNPTVSYEALQALRAILHNYPDIVAACWQQVSNIVYEIFRPTTFEASKRTWNGHYGNTVELFGEKVITATVRVLDECLRAISGFRGTEDLLEDKFLDTPFTSDCVRTKKISSAPSNGATNLELNKDELGLECSGNEQWCEAIERHMPLILHNSSAMVRAASVTCFAGITSSSFFSLTKEKQNFILSTVINASKREEAPSVRSAACRAIGVIACFSQIFKSTEILDKFIHAAEINTQDPLVSVRITSSWAIANICDSLRHCGDSNEHSKSMALLLECALRLTKDNDKIKSNAVRALGYLSRFVQCTTSNNICDKQVPSKRIDNTEDFPSCNGLEGSHRFTSKSPQLVSFKESQYLKRMVQAFLSCVTTGNVKVQWNVCHALSNLFLNETLKLQDMEWAPSVFSVLLLLLRDSSNFKIRIQAAAALSVPASIFDYGSSFSDVVQSLEHIVENLSSDQIAVPSNFKYRVALEKQLTSTMLHVLSLASNTDHLPLKDFFVKKASFLEEWLMGLCVSLRDTSINAEDDDTSVDKRKKEMISKAIQSLIKIYRSRNQHTISQRFEKLFEVIS